MAWEGPIQCRHCAIRDLVLFADLSQQDFRLIHRPIREVTFDVGELLYTAGDKQGHVFTIREGLIKLVQQGLNTEQRIVRLLKRGDLAGMEALLEQPFEHDAIVLQPAFCCQIPVAVVEQLNQNTPRLHRQLMTRWQRAISDADVWLTTLSTGPARARVARLLMHLTEYGQGEHFYLPRREDVGAMLGITTETASRIIAEFKRDGILRTLAHHQATANREELSRVSRR